MSHHPDPSQHLVSYWSKRERDTMFDAPSRPDSRLLYHALCCVAVYDGRTLREELERRGYLIETLRFSCKRNRASI